MGRQYILDAIDAALCAGADILSIYNDPASDFQIEKKADNSPLTIADRKAMLTVNSPFRFMNSFVPSKGSTIHRVSHVLLSA